MFSAGQFLVGTLALAMAFESGRHDLEEEKVPLYLLLRTPPAIVLDWPHDEPSVFVGRPTATRHGGYGVSAAVSDVSFSGVSSFIVSGLAF